MIIEIKNFQDGVKCNSITFSSIESFVKVSHRFESGKVYGFASDFGCGGWGLTTCLGGRSEQPTGEVYFNGRRIDCNDLKTYSCFVSENIYDGVNSKHDFLTPRKWIEKALSISGLPYKVEEIKRMFDLSGDENGYAFNNGRFDRDLQYVSGEIWSISIAVGFALGKEIFCFPWLNKKEIVMAKKSQLDLLKKNNKIVLIPSSQTKTLKKICDEVLYFD